MGPIPERNMGRLPADSPEPPPKSPAAVRRQQDLSASSVAANGDTPSYLLSPFVFGSPESREPSPECSWDQTTTPTPPSQDYRDQGTETQEEDGGGGLMGTLKKKKKEKEEREKKDKFQKEMERKEKELEKLRKEELWGHLKRRKRRKKKKKKKKKKKRNNKEERR